MNHVFNIIGIMINNIIRNYIKHKNKVDDFYIYKKNSIFAKILTLPHIFRVYKYQEKD